MLEPTLTPQAAMVPGPICAKCRAIYIASRKGGITCKAQAVHIASAYEQRASATSGEALQI